MTNPDFTTPTLRALAHCEDVLDASANPDDLPPKRILALLKSARSVLMECSVALKPAESRPGSTTAPVSFSGLETERSPIFDSKTDVPGWSKGMIFAVETAKKMGVDHFELTIKDAKGDTKSQRTRNPWAAMYTDDYTEDWQSSSGSTSCHQVTIYAVRIK